MARSMSFIIQGPPIPLQRPRMTGNHCWDSQKQQKLIAGIQLTTQFGDSPMFEGPLQVDFIFHFALPARMSIKMKQRKTGTPHTAIPDTDNIIKFYLDVAQNILYKNDSAVAVINARKIYGDPHTHMIITELI